MIVNWNAMWTQIAQTISETLNYQFNIAQRIQLTSTHHTRLFKISDHQHYFLVKIDDKSAIDKFDSERFALNELIQESLFYVPDSICTGLTQSHAFHVIEWLALSDDSCDNWYDMGVFLAKMHQKHEQAMFGFELDNYLGDTVQPNQWHKKWDCFFSEQRIGWQLQLLAEKGIHICDIDKFVDLTKSMLHHHKVKPSLLHGDLWRGNVSFCNGKPVLFDPAVYFGDREADIALTELFGKFNHQFYQGYQDQYPLLEGYETRKPLYNLYHLLNHANLFAGNYIEDAKISITKLIQASW